MIIHGNYIGSPVAQPNWNQTDVTKPDYILGKENMDSLIGGKQNKHKTATALLSSDKWTNKQQTVSVAGVDDRTTLIVAAAPENYEAYAKAGVYCSAQAAGSLTFTCKSVPTTDLNANVMILS